MKNIFKVNLNLYLEAINEDVAIAMANFHCFTATNYIRQQGFIEDTTTILTCGTEISTTTSVPKESYSKEDLIKVFGEKRAIRILNQLARNLP